jgi:hypothetical protein
MRALLVIGLVVAFLIGGLLALRNRPRMPDADVLERAKKRARDQDAKDERDA